MIKSLLIFALVLVFTAFIFAVNPKSALATNFPSWHWEREQINQFVTMDVAVDDRCDNANPGFRVTLFEGGGYKGARARICGYWDDLSQLPQYKGAPSTKTFNNSVSSYKVMYLPTGYAVQFSSGKDQSGPILWTRGVGSVNEAGGDVDNLMSSLKRVNP